MSNTVQIPALIDCHVHFREPGYEDKATMETEAASAVAGGVHTVCEMPNTNPPTVTIAALADKVRRAAEVQSCDIRFFFGVTEPQHLVTLKDLWTGTSEELQRLKKYCCGVKAYLDHSTGNQKIQADLVDELFKTCAELSIPLVAHCEDPHINTEAAEMIKEKTSEDDVALHSLMRPVAAEEKAIHYAIELAKKHGTPLHVAHLSSKHGLDLVRHAKKNGVHVTCEVAPHHLFLTVEDYEHLGTLGKMNPPLRTAENRDALWEGILDGTVDCIATDHAPHTLDEKNSKLALGAPSGVPGVETTLPLLLTVVNGKWPNPHSEVDPPKLSIEHITKLCFENPNRIFSLGKDGSDKITIDLDAEWTLTGKELHSKCGWTPFEGWNVLGKLLP